jgi:arylsulfatase A-like enzyme
LNPVPGRAAHANREQTVPLLGLPLWLALAGGAVEVGVLYARKRASPLAGLSEDFVWMAPLALLGAVAVPALAGVVLARLWRPRRAAALAIAASAGLVWTNLLLLVPGLADVAALLLALGLALQTVRLGLREPARTAAWARRSMPWLLAGVAIGSSLIWFSLRPESPAAAPPPAGKPANVVLITLDTVRAANLSLYGYSRPTTPALDAFAARGVVFDHAFSTAPWTLPSHGGLFTGRWPHELSASYTTPLDRTHLTLAEYFGRRGYRTAGFAANLGYCSHETGLGRGFQRYEDYPRSLGQVAASSTLVRTIADNFRLRWLLGTDEHLNRVPARTINRRFLEWLPADDDRPFFAFLNYFDAHEPYLPPPPFDRRFGPGRARGRHSPLHHWLWNPSVAHGNMGPAERQEELDAYDGALAALDQSLGALMHHLRAQNLLGNTIVVITSDHGEEFGEHGVYDHGYSLYRASLHVPLIIVAPDRVPSGHRVVAPVSLRDLAATLVDLVQPADGGTFPGRSLAPLWMSADPDLTRVSPVFAEAEPSPDQPDWFPSSRGRMQSVMAGGMRYIRNGDGREELYDFAHDPWETTDLVTKPGHQSALDEARRLTDRLGRSAAP